MLADASAAVSAQSLVCHAIRRGDTASHAAQRLTGNGRNKYQPWFQIVAPSGSFVPKSQYDRVRAGWRACIVSRAIDVTSRKTPVVLGAAESSIPATLSASGGLSVPTELSSAVEEPDVLAAPVALAPADASRGGGDLTVFWFGAAIALPWFGWRLLDDALDRRRRAAIVMRYFADRFVREFERPLIQQHDTERPVRARFRTGRFGRRLEILLAPGTGRRYPNLTDHKQNVEYDVTRVLQAIADDSFVSGPLRAYAEWVVVPFHVNKAGPKPRV